MIVKRISSLAQFSPQKMGKVTIAEGQGLMLGLNCFEAGQEHAAHTHAGQDKLYVVVEGMAEVQVASERGVLGRVKRPIKTGRGDASKRTLLDRFLARAGLERVEDHAATGP